MIRDLTQHREIWRIAITEAQMIEYTIRRQDPKILGDDARELVTKFPVQDGDVLLVLRPPRASDLPVAPKF